jgi:hypothetical protein
MLSIPIIIFHILTLNIGSVKTKTITRHVRASVVNNRKSSDERNKTSRVNKFRNMFPIFRKPRGTLWWPTSSTSILMIYYLTQMTSQLCRWHATLRDEVWSLSLYIYIYVRNHMHRYHVISIGWYIAYVDDLSSILMTLSSILMKYHSLNEHVRFACVLATALWREGWAILHSV